MTKALSSPLAAIIGRAAKSLPATGEIAARTARANAGTGGTIVLCDTSSSMLELARDATPKLTIVRQALSQITMPHRLFAFDTGCRECPTLPDDCGGGTAMHLALERAVRLQPALTVLLTDGHPDSEPLALAAAERLTGQLRCIYIGPESDSKAIDFLRRLSARAAVGTVTVNPLATQPLLPTLRRLLHA